jgi:hypothetical protein
MKQRHPETFARLPAVCVHAAFAFDLDDHVAAIVEVVARGRASRGQVAT